MASRLPLIFALVAFVSSVGAQEGHQEVVAMPDGFTGIHLGMSVQELVRLRPGAFPSHRKSQTERVDITRPNQTLKELSQKDPQYRLVMLVSYSVREGTLKSVVFMWAGEMPAIVKQRPAFLSGCLNRWGSGFVKRVIKQYPNTDQEHFAPLLLWEKGKSMVSAVCTPHFEHKPLERGSFTVCLFYKDDAEVARFSAGEEADQAILDKLFSSIGIRSVPK